MRIFISLIIIILFTCLTNITATDIRFKTFGVKDGLANESSYKLIQDKEGYIWIGTYDGLNRFDGVHYKSYKSDIKDTTSIAGNVIMDLMIDNNNTLWVATDQGVCVYNNKLDRFDKPIPSLATAYVKSFIQDKDKNYWFASGKFAFLYDSTYKLVQIFNQDLDDSWIGNTSVLCITQDYNGLIWIATQERGIFSYNLKTKEKKSYSDQVTTKQFFTAVPDKYGNIWFGSNDEPYVYVIKDSKFYNLRSPDCPYKLPHIKLSYVAQDSDGILWMSNWADGFTRFDIKNNTYETYVHDENDKTSISGGSIEYAYIDKEGNIWTVGMASGLNVIYKNQRDFNYVRDNNKSGSGIFKSPTTAIAQDSKGNFWFGTDGGGLSEWNMATKSFLNYLNNPNYPKSYGGPSVLTIFFDSKERLWAGGYNSGLNLFNSETKDFTIFKYENAPPYHISAKDIRDVIEDKSGRIWVATNGGGICVYDPITFKYSVINSAKNGIVSDYCLTIMLDNKKNRLFIGSYNGFTIFNLSDSTAKIYAQDKNSNDSLPSNWIYSLYEDSKGRYWLGTTLGLAKFDDEKGKFKTYLETDGLANNTIMAIIEDSEGKLWISTGNGISLFDPDKEQFQNYNIEDGLPDNQFRMNSVIKTNNGLLFFGSNNGVLYFDPKEITKNPTIPVIHFTSLIINNQTILPGKSRILEESIEYAKRIKLRHKENFLRIDFIALSYFQANKNRYEYKLEGVDDNWVNCGNNTSASYTNLSPGRYTFMVRAYNNDGIQSEVKSIRIRVIPPWYKTKVFILFVLLVIGYLVYRYFKQREEQNIQDKLILQQKIDEARSELDQKIKEVEVHAIEIKKRDELEKEMRYQTEGIAMFSDIIAKNRQNLSELTTSIIIELVNYIGANAGAIFIADDSDPENIILRATGEFCFDSDDSKRYEFEAGEGYIGTCYVEKKTIQVDNLPDGYIVLRSGLGQNSLRHSLLVPIVNEMNCLGVIEIASIEKLENYVITFINKLAETIASVLAISKATEKTQLMLEQNKIQSEELQSQEEELRQNLEEMQATQEDLRRQMEAASRAQESLEKEKVLIDTLLKYAKEAIYFKDKQSRFIKVSDSMAKLFNLANAEDLYGKSDFDFFTDEHARPAFEDEMNIIKTGIPIIDKVEKETYSDGRVTYVSTSKMPLYDHKKQIIGTFGISKDITDLMNMEMEIKQRNEELLAQEEELRQNLEEMQAVQESLQAKVEENQIIQDELSKEKYLMDALLNTVPEYIYFKDKESKFIKNSQSHVKLFGFNDPKAIVGKSDFDFFDSEHSKPAFDDEQRIIQTGVPIINLVEKEVKKDGSVSYVSTTKLPLRNEKNEIVGTFGISKDITEQIIAENDLKEKNEILLTQEEELRQSLEEMHTVQENLQSQIENNTKMQDELVKEKALLDAIMNNLPDYIYFKDRDSKFIRISKSMLKLFPVKTLDEMIGKSDFDFQPKEAAQKYFEEELNIINSGEGFTNNITFEIMENGVKQWVSSTKMPLYDQTGKCIGTFGITKDITEIMKHSDNSETTDSKQSQKKGKKE